MHLYEMKLNYVRVCKQIEQEGYNNYLDNYIRIKQ